MADSALTLWRLDSCAWPGCGVTVPYVSLVCTDHEGGLSREQMEQLLTARQTRTAHALRLMILGALRMALKP